MTTTLTMTTTMMTTTTTMMIELPMRRRLLLQRPMFQFRCFMACRLRAGWSMIYQRVVRRILIRGVGSAKHSIMLHRPLT
jgi:hypothetical protein